ncbi:MAG: cytochrome c oxidase subunit II transmembrane domain-containing protein [Planctomycetota bacterium]|nr:cytochrome c oxidase subunit II transmembrane domain-containing protein [Planctomycetota bacterium]
MLLFAETEREGTLSFPLPASGFANDVDQMYVLIFWISLVFFVLIVAAMVYFVVKYRRDGSRLPEKSPSHHTGIELAWTIGPSFLLVYMFWYGALGYLDMRTPPQSASVVERTIDVTAFKYGWQFTYPNGDITTELHLAKDVPVRFRIKSNDTLHAFFIREFRIKIDCVPGRYTECWVTPTMTRTPDETLNSDGTRGAKEPFHLACAEYCGEGHSQMRTEWKADAKDANVGSWAYPVYVHDCSFEALTQFTTWKPSEHTRWQNGEFYFKAYGCVGCHALEGAPQKVGPNFKKEDYGAARTFTDGSTGTFDENYILESINYSTAKVRKGYPNQMPKFNLSDEQLRSLLDFIRSPLEDPNPQNVGEPNGKSNDEKNKTDE